MAQGRKKGKEPVNFVLMLLINDTRFWYHDLIGQITDLWQVTCSSKYTQVHANVFDANTFQQRKHVIIWQVKLPYWHLLQDNWKIYIMGRWAPSKQSLQAFLPVFFPRPHFFTSLCSLIFFFALLHLGACSQALWEPYWKVGEVSCVKSVDCIFVVNILLITVTLYFNFLWAK